MSSVTIEEAQSDLQGLIGRMKPGEEVVITRDEKPVARLTVVPEPPKPPPRFGTLRGTVLYMAPDFDAPLEEFKEYME